MKKTFLYVIIIILALLVTFFGLGPVLFADGTIQERFITLLLVILCYIALYLAARFFKKRI